MKNDSLNDPLFVRSLFDEMAATYGVVNLLSSFGFTIWWRRKCARELIVQPDSVVVDLMAGMGELCLEIDKNLGKDGQLLAIDISPTMCRHAERLKTNCQFRVIEADALACPIEDSSVDYVFSSFGLKTFNHHQLSILASEVKRILRPGGQFSFLEISVPPGPLLRVPYMFYLNRIVPTVGRALLGNPDNYRLLGVYTSAFGNCQSAIKIFGKTGMVAKPRSYFFGCATGLVGHKPS